VNLLALKAQFERSISMTTSNPIEKVISSYRELDFFDKSQQGHLAFGGQPVGVASGVLVTIIPSIAHQREEGYFDVFHLGMSTERTIQVINHIVADIPYTTDDNTLRIWSDRETLHLRFNYKHDPSRTFLFSFNSDSAELFIKWLAVHCGARRNDQCPCGSGAKYKRCCDANPPPKIDPSELLANLSVGSTDALPNLPSEFDWLHTIDDPEIQQVLAGISADDYLHDEMFWAGLGTILGARGQNARAKLCFERSLSIDPTFHGATINLAATLSVDGDHQAALNLLDEVPSDHERYAVIRGNILTQSDRNIEAIPFYERVIHEEPDFFYHM
jgi:hypothetical protein